MKADILKAIKTLDERIADKVICKLVNIIAHSALHLKEFPKANSLHSDIDCEQVSDQPATPADTRIPTSSAGYHSIKEYAIHRKLCEKTVRNYLYLLPHSTVGGIRIKWIEADQALDKLERPPRGRRKSMPKERKQL